MQLGVELQLGETGLATISAEWWPPSVSCAAITAATWPGSATDQSTGSPESVR